MCMTPDERERERERTNKQLSSPAPAGLLELRLALALVMQLALVDTSNHKGHRQTVEDGGQLFIRLSPHLLLVLDVLAHAVDEGLAYGYSVTRIV